MAKKYFQTFKVQWGYQFPVDMLRYDSCFPYTEKDAGIIQRSLTDGSSFLEPKEVRLARYVDHKKFNEPTVDRWKSFGAEVSDVQVAG